jgi:chromosome segregation ATPase
MTEGDDRMTAVEKRLDTIGDDVRVLKDDVRVLQDDVRVLKDDVRVLKDDVRVLKDDVRVLKDDVRVLKDDVRVLKDDVRGLTDNMRVLTDDVRGLHVLYEHHDSQIRMIAEVQAHHGRQLEEHGQLLREIKVELAPLRDLRDFVGRMAANHENASPPWKGTPASRNTSRPLTLSSREDGRP